MNVHSSAFQMVSFLLDWAARAAFLAAVAGLVVALIRMRNVRTRLALWSALLCGSLALPALRPVLPPLLPPIATPRVLVNAPVVVHRVIARTGVRSTRPLTEMATPRRTYIWETALGLWAAGALLLLARLTIGLILARRVIRAAAPIEDKTRQMRDLRVCESPRASVPLTAGVFCPVILLPANWREWENERLRAVLAHERSHVERRDGLIRVAARLHRAALWFSPVSWWLERHLADLAECASDDSALAETLDRSAYASIVLDFFGAGRKRLAVEGLAMAQGGSAARRIDRILAGGSFGAPLRRGTLIAVLALTAGCVALVASLQNAPPVPAPPTAPHVAPVPPPVAQPAAPPAAALQPAGTGDAWVLFRGDSSTTSGDADLEEAQAMHDRSKQDMIWVRRGDKAWVINDASLLRQAADLFRPVDDLSKKQEAFSQQQEALSSAQEALSQAMEKVRGNMPRLENEMKKLEEQLRVHEPTADQLSQLQEKLSKMQNRLAEAQAGIGGRQEEIGQKMEELGRKQGDLGHIQELLGKDREKAAEQAERMLERLLNEAIRNGQARPCSPIY